jgi:signal transduction histidine kinase
MGQLELRRAFEELQKHTQRLLELNATKDKLFSVIAHDLRAPISGVFGLSEMLLEYLETQPKETCVDLAQEIHDSSQQTLSLLDNLLRWSLLERGQFDYQPMTIPLLAIVQKNLRLLSSVALKKHIQIHIDCPSHIFVLGDKNMLASVFQNLLTNAIKFTACHGEIFISAQETQQKIVVTIKDTGVGMSSEQIAQLFVIEKNVSTHGTAGETGTGLGLVLCKQFLALHQSDLCVQSEVGVGTQFSFALAAVAK